MPSLIQLPDMQSVSVNRSTDDAYGKADSKQRLDRAREWSRCLLKGL